MILLLGLGFRVDYGLLIFPRGERLVPVLSVGDNSPAASCDLPNHPVIFFFGERLSTADAVLATPLTFSRRNFLINGEDS